MFKIIEGIKKAIEEKTAYYYKDAHNFNLEWSEYISVLYKAHKNIKENKHCNCDDFSQQHKDQRFQGHNGAIAMLLYNKFDPVIFNVCKYFKCGDNIEKFVLENTNTQSISIKLIANIAGAEDGDGYIHKDQTDVMSFQLTGICQYRIFKNIPQDYENFNPIKDPSRFEYVTYDLKPGTLIFVPKGVYHQVLISEPRITAVADFTL